MNIEIIYHSKTGNTKKIAECIGECVSVEATAIEDASKLLTKDIDLLFLGDGMYYGSLDKSMKQFIEKLDKNKIKNIAMFSTSGGSWQMALNGMRKRLEKQGLHVLDVEYKCHGNAFGLLFASHPSNKDFEDVKAFVEKALNCIK